MSTSTRQRQHSVVVGRRGAVDISPLADEELYGGVVAGPGSLHERRAAALRLVLQLGGVVEEHLGHRGVPVLAGVCQGRVASLGLRMHLGSWRVKGGFSNYLLKSLLIFKNR